MKAHIRRLETGVLPERQVSYWPPPEVNLERRSVVVATNQIDFIAIRSFE